MRRVSGGLVLVAIVGLWLDLAKAASCLPDAVAVGPACIDKRGLRPGCPEADSSGHRPRPGKLCSGGQNLVPVAVAVRHRKWANSIVLQHTSYQARKSV